MYHFNPKDNNILSYQYCMPQLKQLKRLRSETVHHKATKKTVLRETYSKGSLTSVGLLPGH